MPIGTPIAIEAAAAATTSTSVSTVSFQRFWLMMKRRPTATPSASFQDFCSHQASAAITATRTTGGTISRRSTSPSSTTVSASAIESKNHSKLVVRKSKKDLPQRPMGIFALLKSSDIGSTRGPLLQEFPSPARGGQATAAGGRTSGVAWYGHGARKTPSAAPPDPTPLRPRGPTLPERGREAYHPPSPALTP